MNTQVTYVTLIFREDNDGLFDVYEQHIGDGKGCFMTDEAYVSSVRESEIDSFVEEYSSNIEELFGGKFDGFRVIHLD